MALSARYACLLLALALAASAAWAAADAPSPSPPCNNATHHDDALVTYFMTGKNLRVKDIREDKRGLTAVLETKLSETSSALPYIVHDGDVIKHGMVDLTRFLKDWALLQEVAGKEGKYGNVVQAAAAQCAFEYNETALAFLEAFDRDLSPMATPPNALLFTEAYPDKAAVLDILDVKLDLDADRVTYTVLFIDGPEMVPENVCHERQGDGKGAGKMHYHLPSACADIDMALDWLQLAVSLAVGDDSLGSFALSVKT